MNKEDILKRSREENKNGDEREKTLEQQCSQNSYISIMFVFIALGWIALFQEILGYQPFTDYRVISMAFCIGLFGNFITRYIYEKRKLYLIIAGGGIIMAVSNFIYLILGK